MIQRASVSHAVRSEYVLSDSEIALILNNTLDLRDRLIIELMLYCGLRLAETSALEIARIDFAAGDFTVFGKGKRLRRVPMPPFVAAHLKAYIGRRHHGYVFVGRDGPHLTDGAIQDMMVRTGARSGFIQRCPGLKHLNPHMLRHTCARRMKDAGMPWEGIAKILGHKNIMKCIQLYGTLTFEETKSRFLEMHVAKEVTPA